MLIVPIWNKIIPQSKLKLNFFAVFNSFYLLSKLISNSTRLVYEWYPFWSIFWINFLKVLAIRTITHEQDGNWFTPIFHELWPNSLRVKNGSSFFSRTIEDSTRHKTVSTPILWKSHQFLESSHQKMGSMKFQDFALILATVNSNEFTR